ncbi:MAG TPA: ABC transporter ATP-binding protein [Candidatus Binatus sp.]|nr:ABC transporter ATP-binding protein [Candidatus Binatus sp.]
MTDRGPEIVEYPTRSLSGGELERVGDRRGGRPSRRPSQAPGDEPGTGAPRGPLVRCEGLVKIYKVADLEVVALQGLDLLVEPGEFIALVGASGSGKSTLLNILAGLDVPSAGRCVVAGHDLGNMGRRERTAYRRRVIGFVWQQTARNLLGYLTTRQNVELPMLMNGLGRRARVERAVDLLGRGGLADRLDHRPEALSGGEQQRAAIAVALANQPAVLLADEPTGELDTVTAREIFDLLRAVNRELGVTIVVVTHDPLVSEQVSRTIAIRDGRTSTETLRRRATTTHGDHEVVSEEYAVLDRVGRLQLPRSHVEALGLQHRVRLVLESDHITVWPDRDRSPGDDGDGEAD